MSDHPLYIANRTRRRVALWGSVKSTGVGDLNSVCLGTDWAYRVTVTLLTGGYTTRAVNGSGVLEPVRDVLKAD